MRIAIIGCGAIGSVIVEAIATRQIENAELVGLMDIYPEKCVELLKRYGATSSGRVAACRDIECLLEAKPELVVEEASQQAVKEIVPKLLRRRVDVVVLSVGALLDRDTYRELLEESRRSRASVYVPSGAIVGIDAVKALANVGIKRVVVRTYKNAQAFDRSTLEKLGIREVRGRAMIYQGSGEEAVKLFSANVNIAATLALASGVIPWVEIYADPDLERNIHEIEIESNASRIHIRVESVPHPQNPRTSYLAALSAIQLLKQLTTKTKINIGS